MGKSIAGSLFDPANLSGQFGPGNVGGEAAEVQSHFLQLAIDEMRRQFDETQENINPFIVAGQGALPSVVDSATPQGLDANLRAIFNTDIFGGLVDERERAVRGQLGAGGLTRSGTALQEIANVPTNLGLQLEGLLSGRTENISNTGLQAAQGLGSLGQSNSANIASNIAQQGFGFGSGIITDAQAQAAQQQQALQAGATAASIFFSDPDLKEDVEPISEIGDLTLYEWSWIPETKGTMIEKCGTMGFMADEVKEKYPEYVSEYGGFMVVAYPALLNALEAKWVQHGHA